MHMISRRLRKIDNDPHKRSVYKAAIKAMIKCNNWNTLVDHCKATLCVSRFSSKYTTEALQFMLFSPMA
ncbi:Hypothetical protein NTJ_13022 [Nesidiocoris tenuis]|uniref:Uncharacterized protein n=1 Tax=Nesidiocoris tenuis TaxID=355587 RepID=A0ABN7B727_9HEMI|nr:Hypothetical protein NTJ_13022 [Nesidiocoris tenuis]